MANVAYEKYIQSPEWRIRADMAKYRAGFLCQSCGKTSDLQAHHRTYERLGHELPDDIEVLCSECHKARHGKLLYEHKPIERLLRAHAIVPRREMRPGSNPWRAYSKAKTICWNHYRGHEEYDRVICWVTNYLGV